MSHGIDAAFLEKMLEAKRLEKEALMMILPDNIKGHLEVISREVKAILVEMILDTSTENDQNTKTGTQPKKNRVNKVDIG